MTKFSSTKSTFVLGIFAALLCSLSQLYAAAPRREYYQLKVYHLKDNSQRDRLDAYLKDAYLPALHRAGISKIGVFKPAEADSLVYVLIPFKSVDQFAGLNETLAKDKQYATAGQDYLNAAFDKPAYKGFESVLMEAFAGMPSLIAPKLTGTPAERIYELRLYEAATEKLHEAKIAQFNNGELDIFSRLGFNTIFCGQVKAGAKLPSMMYMTSFASKADRDAHWKSFSADPAWKSLNALPEYAHNFLRADIYLLHPAAYSEI
ncbi:NIPSNAP family protein [Fibrella sp. HMF5335]|uniref:NIPSNAP family protein n=1 Tax=Fibrella rubiginis TaxID=2817060 RepID=A0A939GBN5_9BACT|nr:NIPSNAP family protein [Fibrella rubiginis]MBO0936072.1 NIPSNAP family protein [Fibrella rubiginis]